MSTPFNFALPVKQLSRDARIIIISRSLTTFAHGFLAVLLGIYLAEIGFTLVQVGAFFSIGVAGGAIFASFVGVLADKIGRRKLLITFTLLTAVVVLLCIWVEKPWLLMVIAFWGNLNGEGGGGSSQALQPIEQASLSGSAPASRRTEVFALYRIAGTGSAAFGALAAGLPKIYQGIFEIDEVSAIKSMFILFTILLFCGAFSYSFLSKDIEVQSSSRGWTNPLTLSSRKTIFKLVGLFSLDRFAGSFIIQGLVAYWFKVNFEVGIDSLALLFFFSQILSASGLWISAKLSNKIGRINTMVFTHVPASLFLLGAGFAPNVAVAMTFWLMRALLGTMDVPPRDSYTMSIVNEDERVAMASMHIVGRNLAGTIGPSVGTLLWQNVAIGAPFVACCLLRLIYDGALYSMFRNVVPEDRET